MSLHVTLDAARTVTTPAATMRTLVTPSTSPGMEVAVWRTDLPAGAVGPRHAIDGDQFVVVLSGALTVEIDGTAYDVGAGDGILLPGGAQRVISTATSEGAATITVGNPGAFATVGDNAPVPVPWTA